MRGDFAHLLGLVGGCAKESSRVSFGSGWISLETRDEIVGHTFVCMVDMLFGSCSLASRILWECTVYVNRVQVEEESC